MVSLKLRAGKTQEIQEKFQTTLQQQQHLFPGTMQRCISADEENPEHITILLIWKDTELTDESALHRDLEAFKAAFAELLDWKNARYVTKQAIIHT